MTAYLNRAKCKCFIGISYCFRIAPKATAIYVEWMCNAVCGLVHSKGAIFAAWASSKTNYPDQGF